jgi:RNA-directed DNA polymerase
VRNPEGLNERVSRSPSLVDKKQQGNRSNPYLKEESEGAARSASQGSLEAATANERTESSVEITVTLMEEVVERENLKEALERVESNKGAPGVDRMTYEELRPFLKQHWLTIKDRLLQGRYLPQPVRRVEIPKSDGGVRKLGIPTVLDRFIQQALMQVLQERWDPTFSIHSYGLRPKRSCHQAIKQAQEYLQAGYSWTVDMDLERFFDRVNHDRLMTAIAKRVEDKRVLKLIRRYLNAGVMENGLVQPSTEGTPQGGPLSPLLSNLVLDELDRELERRGHRFVRYADDCNVYVKSEVAGKRVMESLARFITTRLKLRVNESKSAVARPWKRKFLGFSFEHKHKRLKLAPQSLKRFKERVRKMTRRVGGRSLKQVITSLNQYLTSWMGYFKIVETKKDFEYLDKWLRRRLRCFQWKQWGRRGYRELRKLGISVRIAWNSSKSAKGWWRLSRAPALHTAMCCNYFNSLGLRFLLELQST